MDHYDIAAKIVIAHLESNRILSFPNLACQCEGLDSGIVAKIMFIAMQYGAHLAQGGDYLSFIEEELRG